MNFAPKTTLGFPQRYLIEVLPVSFVSARFIDSTDDSIVRSLATPTCVATGWARAWSQIEQLLEYCLNLFCRAFYTRTTRQLHPTPPPPTRTLLNHPTFSLSRALTRNRYCGNSPPRHTLTSVTGEDYFTNFVSRSYETFRISIAIALVFRVAQLAYKIKGKFRS